MDHHLHGLGRAHPEALDEFRRLFTESSTPGSGATWRRGSSRRAGFVALKTIAAYRGGLRLDEAHPVWEALEANEASGGPLPVQVHCGFGDSDLLLPHADRAT